MFSASGLRYYRRLGRLRKRRCYRFGHLLVLLDGAGARADDAQWKL